MVLQILLNIMTMFGFITYVERCINGIHINVENSY